MNSSDLTANLYFSAAVRVAADVSLTRLLPLDALRLPLAPHEHYSQRVLLALQALGVIEPELSPSHADDWLLARDWMHYGFDSVAWRIRWAPRDCSRQHDVVKALFKDIEPTEDAMQAFPTVEDVSIMAQCQRPFGFGSMLMSPDEVDSEIEAGRFGPLRYSTRLAWPEGT